MRQNGRYLSVTVCHVGLRICIERSIKTERCESLLCVTSWAGLSSKVTLLGSGVARKKGLSYPALFTSCHERLAFTRA